MGKVSPGDPVKIQAGVWNTLLDVAGAHRSREVSAAPGSSRWPVPHGLIVEVKNNTGAAVPRYHAIGLDDPLFTPTDNEQTFLNQLVFNGETISAEYFGKFAVVQETIEDGRIGKALLQGITVAEITVDDENHVTVDVDPAGGSKLVTQSVGAGRILYKESGTGSKWAVIRVGAVGCAWVAAKVTSQISARSGATVGSGEATLYRRDSTALTAGPVEMPIHNTYASTIAVDTWITIVPDAFGTLWVSGADCPS